MIKPCTCKHAAQDELHGKGMRVHTEDKNKTLHCTVCGPKPSNITRLINHAKNWLPLHSMPNK